MKLKKIAKVLIWSTLSVSGGTLVLSAVLAWQFLESGANHWFLFGTFWDRLIQHDRDKMAIFLSILLCVPFFIQPHWKTALLAMLSFPIYLCFSEIFEILSD